MSGGFTCHNTAECTVQVNMHVSEQTRLHYEGDAVHPLYTPLMQANNATSFTASFQENVKKKQNRKLGSCVFFFHWLELSCTPGGTLEPMNEAEDWAPQHDSKHASVENDHYCLFSCVRLPGSGTSCVDVTHTSSLPQPEVEKFRWTIFDCKCLMWMVVRGYSTTLTPCAGEAAIDDACMERRLA